MKSFLYSLVCVIASAGISGAIPFGFWKAAAGGGGYTVLKSEDFEGTGFEETWGGSGADPDYATSPAPLEGSQSLRAFENGGAVNQLLDFGADQDAVTVCFMAQATAWTADYTKWFILLDNAYGQIAFLNPAPTSILSATHGGQQGDGAVAFNTGVTYYFWIEYTKSTASNGVLKVYRSTTTTRGAAEISITNGSGTAAARFIQLYLSGTSANIVIDHLRVITGAADTVTSWPP